VLQNILTLGFPIIPGYQNFLAAEKATVSSRFTASKGAISAMAEDIWLQKELMLLTARIRGGNSGGPIINEQGSVVGIAVNSPHFDRESDKYDDMGYGVAISSNLILDEFNSGNFIEIEEKINFTDFE
jgi:S1-C subfamily serine protease